VEFVKGLLKEVKVNKKDFGTADRITGLLTLIEEELQDVPLFHVVDDMCATLHCTSPSMLVLRYCDNVLCVYMVPERDKL
jgi:tRNA (guanine26-N2/guanine27-N2)-dimethyltransferase